MNNTTRRQRAVYLIERLSQPRVLQESDVQLVCEALRQEAELFRADQPAPTLPPEIQRLMCPHGKLISECTEGCICEHGYWRQKCPSGCAPTPQ